MNRIVAVAIIVVVALIVIAALFFTGNLAFLLSHGKEPITSVDLHVLGFHVVEGWVVDHSSVIFLGQSDDFVNLAHQWNVTTVFLSYDSAIFACDGVIYCYSW
jgi:hypothetical protein